MYTFEGKQNNIIKILERLLIHLDVPLLALVDLDFGSHGCLDLSALSSKLVFMRPVHIGTKSSDPRPHSTIADYLNLTMSRRIQASLIDNLQTGI